MKQRAKVYKGKRVVMGDKNRVTKHEIHVNDIPQQGGESGGSNGGGGGNTPKPALTINDVTFYDYDGTILYSYTKDEFLRLKEMPPLPTQEGLICQEWNWDFADAKEFVSEFDAIDIGATYITDDGTTRLYITIEEPANKSLTLYTSCLRGTNTIDWGDGTIEQLKSNISHTYSETGDYLITINSVNGGVCLGDPTPEVFLGRSDGVDQCFLRRCHIGLNAYIGYELYSQDMSTRRGGLYNSKYLEKISIPNTCTRIASNGFCNCFSLKCLIIPRNCIDIYSNALNYTYGIKTISFPKGIKLCEQMYGRVERLIIPTPVEISPSFVYTGHCSEIISNTLIQSRENVTLKKVRLPLNFEGSLGWSAFENCKSLRHINLPQGITTLPKNGFSECKSLISIVVPSSVTIVEPYALKYCESLVYVDFSEHKAIPSLENKSAFNSTHYLMKIVVPDTLYDEWIVATNWSSVASNIIKKSDWDAQNL